MDSRPLFKYVACSISLICILMLFVMTQQDSQMEVNLGEENIKRQRLLRDNAQQISKTMPKPYYYEEQQPVLVHAEHIIPTKQPDNNWAEYYGDGGFHAYPNYEDYDSTEDYQPEDDARGTPDYPDMLLQQKVQRFNEAVEDQEQHQSTINNMLSLLGPMKTMWDIYKSVDAAAHTKNPAYEQTSVATETARYDEVPLHNAVTEKPAVRPSTLSNMIAIAQHLKRMWDLYQAFNTPKEPPVLIHPREADAQTKEAARYIKGDPLKGYYDFVITEGSYKFWAAFQLGTAILIIYSTFAAIYYSKVNPLTSDYDYTDYLGGARALQATDVDFVDTEYPIESTKSANTDSWYTNIIPKFGHTLQTVLETIDELPTFEQEKFRYDAPQKKSIIAQSM